MSYHIDISTSFAFMSLTGQVQEPESALLQLSLNIADCQSRLSRLKRPERIRSSVLLCPKITHEQNAQLKVELSCKEQELTVSKTLLEAADRPALDAALKDVLQQLQSSNRELKLQVMQEQEAKSVAVERSQQLDRKLSAMMRSRRVSGSIPFAVDAADAGGQAAAAVGDNLVAELQAARKELEAMHQQLGATRDQVNKLEQELQQQEARHKQQLESSAATMVESATRLSELEMQLQQHAHPQSAGGDESAVLAAITRVSELEALLQKSDAELAGARKHAKDLEEQLQQKQAEVLQQGIITPGNAQAADAGAIRIAELEAALQQKELLVAEASAAAESFKAELGKIKEEAEAKVAAAQAQLTEGALKQQQGQQQQQQAVAAADPKDGSVSATGTPRSQASTPSSPLAALGSSSSSGWAVGSGGETVDELKRQLHQLHQQHQQVSTEAAGLRKQLGEQKRRNVELADDLKLVRNEQAVAQIKLRDLNQVSLGWHK
jgi:hypothetical protein